MINGKTRNGFKFKIDERVLTDWRLVKASRMAQSGTQEEQIEAVNTMFELLLGKDGMAALEEFIAKKNDGYIPASAIMEELKDIIESSQKLKN